MNSLRRCIMCYNLFLKLIDLQVLAQDEDEENFAHAEADTFHLFTTLMSSLHSIFVRPAVNPPKPDSNTNHVPATQLSHAGMSATLERFWARVRAYDDELTGYLDEEGLETTFYAFRWFTCLAPGGLGLPDTIRLWDSLFADWCLEQETNPTNGDSGFLFLEDFSIAVLLYQLSSLAFLTE
jgi:Rab-GTPase-TBC domain